MISCSNCLLRGSCYSGQDSCSRYMAEPSYFDSLTGDFFYPYEENEPDEENEPNSD